MYIALVNTSSKMYSSCISYNVLTVHVAGENYEQIVMILIIKVNIITGVALAESIVALPINTIKLWTSKIL